ncbi:histidine phosphatase family protein [Oceanibaculum indicum]|uniref:Phosphoglycerate mutase family protein n=1 Tax=Oceanibaculum indicum P24 TaxID=1207063 RepID=K2J3P9_9PROT|nr:histidine phosphatase family protein [Oceanibaculum indicum]EKE69517.1 phosphoglycerate mutase family protein [Oceanibaculum indicum P24]
MRLVVSFLLILLFALPGTARAEMLEGEALWNALRQGGHVVLFRHAIAPGGGDPANFRLGDCSTQRNLSEEGRQQARAIGDAFRQREVPIARVLASRWCRSTETAELAFGTVEPFPAIDSFFQDRARGPGQTEAARVRIQTFEGPGNMMMVTHQVNITALTDIFPASGEGVVLRPLPNNPKGFAIVGRLRAWN